MENKCGTRSRSSKKHCVDFLDYVEFPKFWILLLTHVESLMKFWPMIMVFSDALGVELMGQAIIKIWLS